MGDVKRIALITNASNFERQKNIIKSIHQTLRKMGGFTLYVISNYGIFVDDMPYSHGEASIYSLLKYMKFDGCILEGNIGSHHLLNIIADKLRQKNIPFVTINIKMEGAPFLSLDSYEAGCELLIHLIEKHNCSRINIVLNKDREVISMQALQAYKDVLVRKGIPLEEKRIIYQTVSIQNGRNLYQIFEEQGIGDAQAVLCVHDVSAIGLCMELESRGFKVPDDMLLCSLNRSTNSIVFRPDITGADRMDAELSAKACYLLTDMINGKEVSMENYNKGNIYYGQSCGCRNHQVEESALQHQQLILAKVEAGNQISRMMQFNDALEEVNSLDELGHNINSMLQGINCKEYFCCLNQRDLKYIVNEEEQVSQEIESPFDDTMVAISGMTQRSGEIRDFSFPIKNLVPVKAMDGDIFIFYPIHHRDRVYGYMVFLNEYFPIDLYNYRICHESIGSSIENLHRQMILKSSIKELDRLHMRDQLTGLYNRFAINRFQANYVEKGSYSVAILDMDGLKTINDSFGHLTGNHAICITADVIRDSVQKGDMVIRYGGDEFQILSHNTEYEYWENLRIKINKILADQVEQQKLPYELGVSLGYAISKKECPFTLVECCELADKAMYKNKKMRKVSRL